MSALTLFKSLADETRLRLLAVLAVYELSVNELVGLLGMGQSRISRHLKILSDAGMLQFRRDGLWVFYSLPREGEAKKFWLAVEPFLKSGADLAEVIKSDLSLAAGIVQERAIQSRQFFNSIAEDWDEISREILAGFNLTAAIMELVPQNGCAVDLGCGTGHALECLLQKSEQVIGVDGSPRMLELARRRFAEDVDRISLRIGDLSHLPLRDEEADFASINMVLHHLPAPGEVLGEIHRILAPKGTLVLTDFNRHEDDRMRVDYGDRWLGFDLETLQKQLHQAGLILRHSEKVPVERGLSLHVITAERPAP